MITDEMALVTAMSGVCRAGVTLHDHVISDKDRQDEDRQAEDCGVDGFHDFLRWDQALSAG